MSYLDACAVAAGDPQADQIGAAIRSALAGRLESPFSCTASCHSDEWLRWFEVTVTAREDQDGNGNGAVIASGPRRGRADAGAMPRAATGGRPVSSAFPANEGGGCVRDEPEGVHGGCSEDLGDGTARALLALMTDGALIVDDLGESSKPTGGRRPYSASEPQN